MPDKASVWGDLSTRILSAVIMVAATALALAGGGLAWGLFALAVTLVMFWELAALCEPGIGGFRRIALALSPVLLPGALAIALWGGLALPPPGPNETMSPDAAGIIARRAGIGLALGLALPPLYGMLTLKAGRLIWAGYGLMVLIGAAYLVFAYSEFGVIGVVVLVVIVAISDILGYFAGRLLGGPKFWPRVSPKKTWSGTIAGWIGAGLFGYFVLGQQGAPLLGAAAAIGLALAGQMGDIAESALKRRVGIKDSSNLIPGHGGFLDRLDALVAASALAGLLTFLYLIWTS
jgi:phosphatidate cytidylyltransferase